MKGCIVLASAYSFLHHEGTVSANLHHSRCFCYCHAEIFVGSGHFRSDNTTFAMEQKVDPETGNPSSFSVLIKNGPVSCLARYDLSETAGFIQATDGGADFDTNVKCQPGKGKAWG